MREWRVAGLGIEASEPVPQVSGIIAGQLGPRSMACIDRDRRRAFDEFRCGDVAEARRRDRQLGAAVLGVVVNQFQHERVQRDLASAPDDDAEPDAGAAH